MNMDFEKGVLMAILSASIGAESAPIGMRASGEISIARLVGLSDRSYQ